MKNTILFLVVFFFLTVSPAFSAVVDTKQFVYGAGPSTKLVQLFFTEFNKLPVSKGYTFEIPPKSVKHSGGIKSSEKYLFGRTGRPMNEAEKKMNKVEIFLGQVPIAIVVGAATGITQLELGQLEKIITGEYTNWKEVGGVDAPIVNVGREANEAALLELQNRYPFFNSAKFNQVFEKDSDVVAFVANAYGNHAIAFGAASNFVDSAAVSVLTIPGFSAGLKMGLVYDRSNTDNPIVNAVAEYAGSREWAALAVANGYAPPHE